MMHDVMMMHKIKRTNNSIRGATLGRYSSQLSCDGSPSSSVVPLSTGQLRLVRPVDPVHMRASNRVPPRPAHIQPGNNCKKGIGKFGRLGRSVVKSNSKSYLRASLIV
jgi:hypothetical protein